MPTTKKPALLVVDDNPDVRSVVEGDLQGRYGEHYQVLAANSAAAALDFLGQLRDPARLVEDWRTGGRAIEAVLA